MGPHALNMATSVMEPQRYVLIISDPPRLKDFTAEMRDVARARLEREAVYIRAISGGLHELTELMGEVDSTP